MTPQGYPLVVEVEPSGKARDRHPSESVSGWVHVVGWDEATGYPMVVADHCPAMLLIGDEYEVKHWIIPPTETVSLAVD